MGLPPVENQIRRNFPQVGIKPYRQIHPHSTGNKNSTAQNEADYMGHKNLAEGFYSHVIGNGRIIQVAPINMGAYDVGGDWNYETYASVELIESHETKSEFTRDYRIYVDFIRLLAKQSGIPLKVDSGSVGLNTHDYCRRYQPNNKTDHVDPYLYLEKWGISRQQFKKDIEKGFDIVKTNPIVNEPWKPRHIVRCFWYRKGHPKLLELMLFCDRNNIYFELFNNDGGKGDYTLIEMRFFAQKGSASKRALIDYIEKNEHNYDMQLEFYRCVKV